MPAAAAAVSCCLRLPRANCAQRHEQQAASGAVCSAAPDASGSALTLDCLRCTAAGKGAAAATVAACCAAAGVSGAGVSCSRTSRRMPGMAGQIEGGASCCCRCAGGPSLPSCCCCWAASDAGALCCPGTAAAAVAAACLSRPTRVTRAAGAPAAPRDARNSSCARERRRRGGLLGIRPRAVARPRWPIRAPVAPAGRPRHLQRAPDAAAARQQLWRPSFWLRCCCCCYLLLATAKRCWLSLVLQAVVTAAV